MLTGNLRSFKCITFPRYGADTSRENCRWKTEGHYLSDSSSRIPLLHWDSSTGARIGFDFFTYHRQGIQHFTRISNLGVCTADLNVGKIVTLFLESPLVWPFYCMYRAGTAKMSICSGSQGSISIRLNGRACTEVSAEDPRALSLTAIWSWQLSVSRNWEAQAA